MREEERERERERVKRKRYKGKNETYLSWNIKNSYTFAAKVAFVC